MREFKLTHLSDAALVRRLAELVVRDRVVTAMLLAHIAEVDARKLYVPAGYPSMHAYCIDELHLSEDAAYKRIQAARAARRFPVLFRLLADGSLHLAGVGLLAPHLTPENVRELVAAARRRRKSEIERMLADRFPLAAGAFAPELTATLTAISVAQLAPGQVGANDREPLGGPPLGQLEASTCGQPTVASPTRCFALHVAIDQRTHDKLRHAQALLSHALPSGDVAEVLDRALDVLIERLEQRKFAATKRPRRGVAERSGSKARSKRCVPADVRRAVWERDQGQCTFSGSEGGRCPARKLLEFDHVDPVALGGRATVDRIRLRCRAHNQFEAERAFGVAFMRKKREEARDRVVAKAAGQVAEQAAEQAADQARTRDVVTALRALGMRADEARRAAELSHTRPDATIEDRVRAALMSHGPRHLHGAASRHAWAPPHVRAP